MKNVKTILVVVGALTIGLILGIIGSNGSNTAATASAPATSTVTVTAPAEPAGAPSTVTVTKAVPGPATTVTVAGPAPAPAADPAPSGDSCGNAKEAILTGSQADIDRTLLALQNDKGANSTAREYARYYLGRDKGQKDLQELDITLIQSVC